MLHCHLTASRYCTICEGPACGIVLLPHYYEIQLEGNIFICSLPPYCKCVDFGTQTKNQAIVFCSAIHLLH